MLTMPAVNWIAIVVAAIAWFILGWLWFSPMLFGKRWMKEMNMKMQGKMDMSKMMMPMVIALIAALILAYVLSVFVHWTGASSLGAALTIGFWVWLGFNATEGVHSVLWEGRSWAYYAIVMGNRLVGILLMSAILTLWW